MSALCDNLSEESWRRICRSLRLFIDLSTESLSAQNVGDKEWTELDQYKSLLTDIETYILPLRPL